MNERPSRIAVIIPAHNEEGSIRDLLESIMAMTRTPEEIVVVDAGSVDGTPDRVREWAAAHDAPVRLITDVGRASPARARNIGIANTPANLLVCVDCGTEPTAEYIEHVTLPIEEQQADLVGGLVVATPRTWIERYFAVFYPRKWKEGDPPLRSFGGTAMAFPRGLWERVGGFPEYLLTGEDPAFCAQAQHWGARMRFVSEARIGWRPRRNLRAFWRQIFRYATTGGMLPQAWQNSQNRRRALKLLLFLLLPAGFLWYPLAIVGGAGLLASLMWNDWKIWRHAEVPAAWLVVPWFALVLDLASAMGFGWGQLRALLGAVPGRDQPTEWPRGNQETWGGLSVTQTTSTPALDGTSLPGACDEAHAVAASKASHLQETSEEPES